MKFVSYFYSVKPFSSFLNFSFIFTYFFFIGSYEAFLTFLFLLFISYVSFSIIISSVSFFYLLTFLILYPFSSFSSLLFLFPSNKLQKWILIIMIFVPSLGIPSAYPTRCDRTGVPVARVHAGIQNNADPSMCASILQRATRGQQDTTERTRVSATVQLHRARYVRVILTMNRRRGRWTQNAWA